MDRDKDKDRMIAYLQRRCELLGREIESLKEAGSSDRTVDALAAAHNLRKEREREIERLKDEMRALNNLNRGIMRQLEALDGTALGRMDTKEAELRAERERSRRYRDGEQRARDDLRKANDALVRARAEVQRLKETSANDGSTPSKQHHSGQGAQFPMLLDPNDLDQGFGSPDGATGGLRRKEEGYAAMLGRQMNEAGSLARQQAKWTAERRILLTKIAALESRVVVAHSQSPGPKGRGGADAPNPGQMRLVDPRQLQEQAEAMNQLSNQLKSLRSETGGLRAALSEKETELKEAVSVMEALEVENQQLRGQVSVLRGALAGKSVSSPDQTSAQPTSPGMVSAAPVNNIAMSASPLQSPPRHRPLIIGAMRTLALPSSSLASK
jgi:regulator of replication initiation timing